ncbi:MAG: hypothetical protein GY801_45165 [bacterium]|nr:hypothetical protein [bacterium]
MSQAIRKFFGIASYLFSPEDSQDSIFHRGPNVKLEQLPRYAEQLKTVLWVLLAFGLAVLLSQLQ